jgi:hypothetical protein
MGVKSLHGAKFAFRRAALDLGECQNHLDRATVIIQFAAPFERPRCRRPAVGRYAYLPSGATK